MCGASLKRGGVEGLYDVCRGLRGNGRACEGHPYTIGNGRVGTARACRTAPLHHYPQRRRGHGTGFLKGTPTPVGTGENARASFRLRHEWCRGAVYKPVPCQHGR